ncbi:MAG: type II toxin-antitoxin system VapC family toxin [Nitrospirae bacterium]|nr:type II toxin-antitoxin system VapC family toxin [Nitrospirota bacterium]
MKRLTLDSSVIISSLLENESRHKEALKIWEGVLSGKNFAIMPYSVFVEVVAAIRRRTGSVELAIEVKNQLLNIESISFMMLDDKAAEDAAQIAAKTGVRGMDALVIQVAKEFGAELISFDEEMIAKAVKVLS